MKQSSLTLLAAALLLSAGSATARDKLLDEASETYSFDDNGSVQLENVNGRVTIEGWSEDEILLEYRVYGKSADDLDSVEIKIDADSDRFSVNTDYKKSSWWGSSDNNAKVEFDLKVPHSAMLDNIDLVNGSLKISGVHGEINAESVNGAIEVSDIGSSAKLATVNGSIEARFEEFNSNQRASLDSVNGRIVVYLPQNADVKIDAETLNGGMKNDFGIAVDKGFVGKDMNGRIGDGGGRLNMETVNGSISVRSGK